jgi:hypothetical protein
MAEADLCRLSGKCSRDAVPCLVVGETKLALMRSWPITTKPKYRVQSKCIYRLLFLNTRWNDLLVVPVLDVLEIYGSACGSVNCPCCINDVFVVVKDKDPFRKKEPIGQFHDSIQLYLGILTVPMRSPIVRLSKLLARDANMRSLKLMGIMLTMVKALPLEACW